jgi:hypothetical protein
MTFRENAISKAIDGIMTALVIGFFALFSWMAKTIYDTGTRLEVMQQRMLDQEALDDRQTDTYNKVLFGMKESIDNMQTQLDNLGRRPILKEADKPKTKKLDLKEMTQPPTPTPSYEEFDAVIQQQITPRGKR